MRLPKFILTLAVATFALGLFAAPKAFADGDESYFFNRRKAQTEAYSLVGPHGSMEATNAAIEWSLQNGYEVEWEADGSAPRILVEKVQPTVVQDTTKVVVVPKVIYVVPSYKWHYWGRYRHYWSGWKLKYRYNPYYHWKNYKKFKWHKGHKHYRHHKVKKFKKKIFKNRVKRTVKKTIRKIRRRRR